MDIRNIDISEAMTIKLPETLPPKLEFDPKIRRAPKRELTLSEHEMKLALKNALR